MTKKRPLSTTGFTIVEVMIVLAVAGLIFLIVFQAIPDLLRDSRNNQRKQDVQLILGAVSHYELNNSGNFPTNADPNFGDFQAFLNEAHLTYYGLGDINTHGTDDAVAGAAPIDNSNPSGIEAVDIYNHAKCDQARPGNATTGGAGYSDVVALYALETGNGLSRQCQQL